MSDTLTSRLLNTISTALKQHIKPQLSGNESLIYIDIVLRMLEFLETRHSSFAADLKVLVDRQMAILSQLMPLLEKANYRQQLELVKNLLDNRSFNPTDTAQLEQMRADTEAVITAIMPTLF